MYQGQFLPNDRLMVDAAARATPGRRARPWPISCKSGRKLHRQCGRWRQAPCSCHKLITEQSCIKKPLTGTSYRLGASVCTPAPSAGQAHGSEAAARHGHGHTYIHAPWMRGSCDASCSIAGYTCNEFATGTCASAVRARAAPPPRANGVPNSNAHIRSACGTSPRPSILMTCAATC